MILREREYILSRGNQKGSEEDLADAPSGRPYDEAGEETEGTGGTPYDEPGAPSIDEPMEGAPAGSPAGGEHNQGRKGERSQRATAAAPPADIPDGSDDDVVARQIREAATQERDPELREKLWEEYRKYKQSI